MIMRPKFTKEELVDEIMTFNKRINKITNDLNDIVSDLRFVQDLLEDLPKYKDDIVDGERDITD